MKIAVVGVKGLPPKQGGIEHYCAEIYPRIVAQGHSVDIYARSSYTSCSWFRQETFKGVRVISLPSYRGGFDALITSALGSVAATWNRYDIIHFHALGPALFSCLPKLSSAIVVVTCHGLDWRRAKWGKLASCLIRVGEKVAVRFADEIIVVSEELKSYFLKTYNKGTIHITTAPASYANPSTDFFYGSSLGLEQGRYILFLGRLVPEKCPDLLIKAFQMLQLPRWKLVLVGGHSNAIAFQANLFKLAGGNPDIVFTGELQGELLAEIVQGAGLFVLPSALEGLPLALLEAMRENIPVVASNILPHQQVVGNSRGLLFPAGDAHACVQVLRWAISHPREMAKIARQARNYVNKYHRWEWITKDNLDLYEHLLNKRKGIGNRK